MCVQLLVEEGPGGGIQRRQDAVCLVGTYVLCSSMYLSYAVHCNLLSSVVVSCYLQVITGRAAKSASTDRTAQNETDILIHALL